MPKAKIISNSTPFHYFKKDEIVEVVDKDANLPDCCKCYGFVGDWDTPGMGTQTVNVKDLDFIIDPPLFLTTN